MSLLASQGHAVCVAIVTRAVPPLYPDEAAVELVRSQARRAHEILGVKRTVFLGGLPAAMLDRVPHTDLNREVGGVIEQVEPDILFIPFAGDVHMDHRLVFEAAMVAVRPNGRRIPDRVYSYETLSETNWGAPGITPAFVPTVFVDVTEHLGRMLEAMQQYESELRAFPNERSLQAAEALSRVRWETVCVDAAEAFVLVRQISRGGLVV